MAASLPDFESQPGPEDTFRQEEVEEYVVDEDDVMKRVVVTKTKVETKKGVLLHSDTGEGDGA